MRKFMQTMPTLSRAQRQRRSHIDDSTAILLSGIEALRQLELHLRAQARRGRIDDDEVTLVFEDVAEIRRALRHAKDKLGELRDEGE